MKLTELDAHLKALVAKKKEESPEIDLMPYVEEYVNKETNLHELFREDITNAIREIQIAVPKVEITSPEIHIPEIKIPDIRIDAPIIPPITVPEAHVTVEIPEIKVPTPQVTVNVEKQDTPIVNVSPTPVIFPDSMDVGLDKFTRKNPMPIIAVDLDGKPFFPTSSGGGGATIFPNKQGFDLGLYDYIAATYPTEASEVYTFFKGGSAGIRMGQITIVYGTSAKDTIFTVTKTPTV